MDPRTSLDTKKRRILSTLSSRRPGPNPGRLAPCHFRAGQFDNVTSNFDSVASFIYRFARLGINCSLPKELPISSVVHILTLGHPGREISDMYNNNNLTFGYINYFFRIFLTKQKKSLFRARWLRSNERDSHSGGPELNPVAGQPN